MTVSDWLDGSIKFYLHYIGGVNNQSGRSYSSVGRAGVPCIEAVSPLQRSQVRLPPVTHLLRVIPSLSAPFPVISSAVSITIKAKSPKNNLKKRGEDTVLEVGLCLFLLKVLCGA